MKSPVVRRTRGKFDISVISRLRKLPEYLSDPDISFLRKGVLLAALIYVISPVDLIPDIPIVGWLDDMGVITATYMYMLNELEKYVKRLPVMQQGK